MDALWLVAGATLFPGATFIVALGLALEAYERKLRARMQSRMGPSYWGPRGLLQPLYDVLKLLSKEDLAPRGLDRVVAGAALVWALALACFVSLLVPWAGRAFIGFPGDAVVAVACLSLGIGLLYLAAYTGRSPYPVLGGLRLLGLLASYDAVLASSLLVAYAASGSSSVSGMARGLWEGLLSRPWLIPVWLIALALGFIALLAEAEKNPFTAPEAEQEVAGGYLAEMSGRRLAFARLVNRVHAAAATGVYVSALLGLPRSQGLPGLAETLAAVLAVYTLVVVVDAATARLRLRDLEEIAWTRLVPAALLAAAVALAAP